MSFTKRFFKWFQKGMESITHERSVARKPNRYIDDPTAPGTLSYNSRYGARSEVTGGHPEDMNQMPPAVDESAETPVFDGSDLKSPTGLSKPTLRRVN